MKGKWGGARPNAGGKREGAGRKPKEPSAVDVTDPLDFLRLVQTGQIEPSPAQLRAAIELAKYQHAKADAGGKKEAKVAAAKAAGTGRFAPPSGPRLAVVGGRSLND